MFSLKARITERRKWSVVYCFQDKDTESVYSSYRSFTNSMKDDLVIRTSPEGPLYFLMPSFSNP
jgi:hypothetical protein